MDRTQFILWIIAKIDFALWEAEILENQDG